MRSNVNHISLSASVLTIVSGCLVLVGWFLDIPFLKSVISGTISMKFNTAICFVLSGICLFLLNRPAVRGRDRAVVWVCSLIVFLLATLNFLEHLLGRNLGIDELLWKEGTGTAGTTYPGRMSQSTAINFMLLSLIFFSLRKKRFHWLIQALLILMIPGSILIIFNHLFDGSFLTAFPQLSKTALPTAILFLLLSFGVFFSKPLEYIRFSFQKKIAGVFALTVLVLGIIFFAYKKNTDRSHDSARLVEHTQEVKFNSELIHREMVELQNNVRGFLITGQEDFAYGFRQSSDTIKKYIHQLRFLIRDEPLQQVKLDSLEKIFGQYIISRRQLISQRLLPGFSLDKKIQATEEGKLLMDRVRAVLLSIQQVENNLLAKRREENEQSIFNSGKIITILQLMAVCLILAAFGVIYYNIRARNTAEREIRAANKRFATIFNVSPVAISISTMEEGVILYVNQALCDLVNLKPEKIIGRKAVELHLIDAEQRQKILSQVAGNSAKGIELTIHKGSGEKVDILYSMEKVEMDGKICLATYIVDISDRKEAERQIKELNETLEKRVEEKTKEIIEKEKQYRFLLENMREGIQVIDPDWKYVFVNKSVTHQGKYSRQELLGRTMMEMYPGIESTKLFSILQECMRERKSHIMENEFTYPDGSKGCFELSIQPVPEGLFILSMDISDRKKAEETIKNSQRLLAQSQEITHIGSWEWDLLTNAVTWTDELFHIYGYEPQSSELSYEFLTSGIHPDDRKTLHHVVEECLRTHNSFSIDFRINLPDGTEKIIHGIGEMIFDEYGKPCKMRGIAADITEQKMAEAKLDRLNKDLKKRADELQASNTELERFAYVASHDLQEPLRMVSSFMQLLEKRLNGTLDETSKKYLDFAVDGSERMKTLIQDLLQYSRVGTNKEDITNVDCNEVLNHVMKLYTLAIREKNAIVNINAMPTVLGVKTQVQQVFQNLLGNALKYNQNGSCKIEVGCKDVNNHWEFYVKDNGIGIDPRYFDKVFVLFQRLHNKNEYSGTGMGLAICKKIVERHRGKIWVESEPGKGSTFYFTLPKN